MFYIRVLYNFSIKFVKSIFIFYINTKHLANNINPTEAYIIFELCYSNQHEIYLKFIVCYSA